MCETIFPLYIFRVQKKQQQRKLRCHFFTIEPTVSMFLAFENPWDAWSWVVLKLLSESEQRI